MSLVAVLSVIILFLPLTSPVCSCFPVAVHAADSLLLQEGFLMLVYGSITSCLYGSLKQWFPAWGRDFMLPRTLGNVGRHCLVGITRIECYWYLVWSWHPVECTAHLPTPAPPSAPPPVNNHFSASVSVTEVEKCIPWLVFLGPDNHMENFKTEWLDLYSHQLNQALWGVIRAF